MSIRRLFITMAAAVGIGSLTLIAPATAHANPPDPARRLAVLQANHERLTVDNALTEDQLAMARAREAELEKLAKRAVCDATRACSSSTVDTTKTGAPSVPPPRLVCGTGTVEARTPATGRDCVCGSSVLASELDAPDAEELEPEPPAAEPKRDPDVDDDSGDELERTPVMHQFPKTRRTRAYVPRPALPPRDTSKDMSPVKYSYNFRTGVVTASCESSDQLLAQIFAKKGKQFDALKREVEQLKVRFGKDHRQFRRHLIALHRQADAIEEIVNGLQQWRQDVVDPKLEELTNRSKAFGLQAICLGDIAFGEAGMRGGCGAQLSLRGLPNGNGYRLRGIVGGGRSMSIDNSPVLFGGAIAQGIISLSDALEIGVGGFGYGLGAINEPTGVQNQGRSRSAFVLGLMGSINVRNGAFFTGFDLGAGGGQSTVSNQKGGFMRKANANAVALFNFGFEL